VLVSEDEAGLYRVKAELEQQNEVCRVHILPVDLFDISGAHRIHQYCITAQLQVDVLINCAGMYVNADEERAHILAVEQIIQLHVLAISQLCFLLGVPMVQRGNGYILNMASITALFHDPASILYGSTKCYIRALSRALHADWKDKGVRVCCLMPGSIRTPFFQRNRVFVPGLLIQFALDPFACAQLGLKALFKGKASKIPGWFGKIQAFIFRLLTNRIFYRFTRTLYYSLKSKNDQKKQN